MLYGSKAQLMRDMVDCQPEGCAPANGPLFSAIESRLQNLLEGAYKTNAHLAHLRERIFGPTVGPCGTGANQKEPQSAEERVHRLLDVLGDELQTANYRAASLNERL